MLELTYFKTFKKNTTMAFTQAKGTYIFTEEYKEKDDQNQKRVAVILNIDYEQHTYKVSPQSAEDVSDCKNEQQRKCFEFNGVKDETPRKIALTKAILAALQFAATELNKE